jgi:hypothetical protein
MAQITIELKGVEEMRERIKNAGDEALSRVSRALYLEAEQTMTRSKQDFVPVDYGDLRSTGHVTQPELSAGYIVVRLRYGDSAIRYALAVHEHPSVHSPPSWDGKPILSSSTHGPPTPGYVTFHPEGRGPKYLERPMRDAARNMAERITNKARL